MSSRIQNDCVYIMTFGNKYTYENKTKLGHTSNLKKRLIDIQRNDIEDGSYLKDLSVYRCSNEKAKRIEKYLLSKMVDYNLEDCISSYTGKKLTEWFKSCKEFNKCLAIAIKNNKYNETWNFINMDQDYAHLDYTNTRKTTPIPGSYIEFQDTNKGIDISQHFTPAVILTISEDGKAIVILEDGTKRELTLTTHTKKIRVWQFIKEAVPSWFYENCNSTGRVSECKAIPKRNHLRKARIVKDSNSSNHTIQLHLKTLDREE